ncbi:hypothetical protein POP12_015 [Pectobacterium phage POP12]|nr:hypothetical protein POP12_015 [Pectobacterium phage POP12]
MLISEKIKIIQKGLKKIKSSLHNKEIRKSGICFNMSVFVSKSCCDGYHHKWLSESFQSLGLHHRYPVEYQFHDNHYEACFAYERQQDKFDDSRYGIARKKLLDDLIAKTEKDIKDADTYYRRMRNLGMEKIYDEFDI